MDINKVKEQIQDEDFLVRIRPFADDEGQWTGEVDISIMAFPENPLNDYDYEQLMHFSKMLCAAVPVMEQTEEIRNVIHEYVLNVIDNEMDITVELEEECGVEKEYDGNIIHLNFNSKTGGSA